VLLADRLTIRVYGTSKIASTRATKTKRRISSDRLQSLVDRALHDARPADAVGLLD
jgi:hypothetical protein